MDEEQLKQLTVRVIAGDAYGTGFFVDSGIVLTCAHVIKSLPSGHFTKVEWNGQKYGAEVIRVGVSTVESRNARVHDAAVLRIERRDHPRAEVDAVCKSGDEVYAYGYKMERPWGDPLEGRCEGTDGRGLIKFRDTLVDHGMSGVPLLNRRTRKVCGMVRTTRDKDAPAGLAICCQ